MNFNQMKDKIEYAQSIRQESTGFFRELLEEFREKQSIIRRNRDLSEEGKRKQIEKLRATYERKALELSKGLQDERRKAASEVKQAAEMLLVSELPAVDNHKRALFNQKVEQLEAAIKFAVTPQRAKEALEQLVSLGDEAALANEVKSKILNLSEHVISLVPPADRQSMRYEIGKLYETASQNALPEGSREAKEILHTAERILNSSGISDLVSVSMREISLTTSTYLHNPEERLAVLNTEPPSPQEQQRKKDEDDLKRLRDKAQQTASINDKIAYVNAKRALGGAE